MFTEDLTPLLPLKADYRAALWTSEVGMRTVFRYAGCSMAEMVELKPGELPTAALLCRRCRPGQWALVSEWRPG